ncbi:MAG: nuclear transport factor 2 family protein [Actinomycetota bacterium]
MNEAPDAFDEIIAYVAICRLQDRYADIVTRRAWVELAEIMRPDCQITLDLLDRTLEIMGPHEIGDFIGTQIERFDFFQFVIVNRVIDVDPGTGRAGARMFIQEARQSVAEGRRCDTYGVYHDRFERGEDGQWRFARRRYQPVARPDPTDHGSDLTVYPLPTTPLDELRDGRHG